MKRKLLKKHRLYLCILITILFLLLSFVFTNSYVRIIESFKDLGLSIAYYFCELFYIPYSFDVTTNHVSNGSQYIVDNFNLFDFSNFGTYFQFGFKASFNGETFLRYTSNVFNKISNFTRFLLIIFPLFILLFIWYKKYFTENDLKPNEDSKQLKFYKKIENKVFTPIKKWLCSFKDYLLDHNYFIIIWCCLFCLYFNIFTIFIEFLAFYFYFVISFDFANIFKQFYKLIIDLLPLIQYVPLPIWLVLALLVFNAIRKKIGYNVLEHYEMRDRGFINSMGQVSMLCAPMGKGKTTALTDIALSQEVMFRDKAFELILENDLKFPNFPFINFENEIKHAIEYHQIYNLASARLWLHKKRVRFEYFQTSEKCFGYDFQKYGLYYDDNLKNIYLYEMLESYVQLYFVYIIQSSLLVSNYGIREDNVLEDLGNFPIWHSDFFKVNTEYAEAYSRHSHILDFDMLRLGRKVIENNLKANAFEFGVIVITEGGKERKNTLELKEVKKNTIETNQKNDLFNLWLKMARHSATIDNFPFIKVLIDEQRPESMGADVRELCEKIIFIREKKETRTPLMFFYFETIIYDFLKSKFTSFYYKFRFVRSDNTLLVYLIKKLVSRYIHYYERLRNTFSYHKLIIESEKGTLDEEFEKSEYYIMYKKIYSRRFVTDCFSDFFVHKSLESYIGLNDVEEYRNEKATLDELSEQNSYFINELLEYTQKE